MSTGPETLELLERDARALLTRIARIRPFALYETAVPAASVSSLARAAIERDLAAGRRELKGRVHAFLAWLRAEDGGRDRDPEDAQRRLTFLRLRFNAVLSRLDIFADVLTQRSEAEIGVWLAGLDAFAEDALALPDRYEPPPLMCYLDRGAGAAIRRARTRLPGGGPNPVAVIRVPRERMVGSGIGSSLVHEVGHQGAALLDLVASLRGELAPRRTRERGAPTWAYWERWISEIVADLWSVGHLGIGATLGLIGVVSLPRAFVFRVNADDPHPVPWLRVTLGCAIGEALFPDPQWRRLGRSWRARYPTDRLAASTQDFLARMESSTPAFVELLLEHRPATLGGLALHEALPAARRRPERLRALFERAEGEPAALYRLRPSLAFAVLGQAAWDGRLGPKSESDLIASLLRRWALRRALPSIAVDSPSGIPLLPAA